MFEYNYKFCYYSRQPGGGNHLDGKNNFLLSRFAVNRDVISRSVCNISVQMWFNITSHFIQRLIIVFIRACAVFFYFIFVDRISWSYTIQVFNELFWVRLLFMWHIRTFIYFLVTLILFWYIRIQYFLFFCYHSSILCTLKEVFSKFALRVCVAEIALQ